VQIRCEVAVDTENASWQLLMLSSETKLMNGERMSRDDTRY